MNNETENILVLILGSIFSISVGATSLIALIYEIRINARRDRYYKERDECYKNELMKAVDKLNEVTKKI